MFESSSEEPFKTMVYTRMLKYENASSFFCFELFGEKEFGSDGLSSCPGMWKRQVVFFIKALNSWTIF